MQSFSTIKDINMDIIIGGGITGLSYAMFGKYEDYLILEKESEVGGYCRTTQRGHYIWDYSGHFFHFQDANIKKMIMEKLYEESKVVDVNKCTHIKYKERLIDYPFQKNIHQLSQEEFIDCLVDLFSSRITDFTTFKEMLYCKFGKSIAEKFLIPYNEKLYACDLDKLDKDAMGRFFPYAEKEQIILNFKRKDNYSYNNTFAYPKNGAVQYVQEISKHLNPSLIKTQTEVKAILPAKKRVITNSGEEYKYDNLISTIPFPTLLKLTGVNYDSNIYSWNKVLVFNLGFDLKGQNQKDHWIYFPEKDYCFYRVGFYDNILNQDRMSLYVELGFNKNDEIHPNEWIGKVLADLKKAGILTEKQTLIDYESIIMNPAYVHITNASIKDVAMKKKQLATNHIYSIGRYGSWTYCSIEDNIKEALELSKQLR